MALTETTTQTVSLRCDSEGRITTIHAQSLTVFTDETGDILSRTAGPALPLDLPGFAALLHADDRAALLAALSANP